MKPNWKHTRFWQRLLSGVLTVVMLVGLLPATAMAALLDNSPARNQEILSELEQIVGSAEEAQTYYELLQRYNLLDEDGNAVTSWHIRMDGEDITLDQLREVLAGDYDPGYYITVDGTPITLGDVATILEIEDYLAYLRETYFDGHQWTAEQQASLNDLVDQINREGITITSSGDTLGGSGVNHAARVSVGYPQVNAEEGTATSTVTLRDAAPGQEVTFDWQALSGTQPAHGEGTEILVADQWGTDSTTLTIRLDPVTTDTVQSDGKLIWYLKLDGITNATFFDGEQVFYWKVEGNPTATSEDMSELSQFQFDKAGANVQVTLTDAQRKAIHWGAIDTVKLTSMLGVLDDDNYLVYRWPNGDKVSVYSYQLFAKAGDVTLAQVNYAGKINSAATDFVIERDETLKECMFAPLTNFQGQITIGGICSKTTYAKAGDKWEFLGGEDVSGDARSLVSFRNGRPPEVLNISAPAGTYYPGQVVPVTITFSEPVNQTYVRVKFNGETDSVSSEVPAHYSNVVTVAYPVKEVDNATLSVSSITARDGGDNYLTDYNPGGEGSSGQLLPGVKIETPLKSAAITNVSAQLTGTAAAPQLQVDVTISSDPDLTRWLGSAMEQNGGRWQTKVDSLFVSLDGGVTKYPLVFQGETVTGQTGTATIDLPKNEEGIAKEYVAELYIDNKLVIGKYASTSQEPIRYITENDLSASITIQKDGQNYTFENPEDPVIYVQSGMPDIQAAFALTGTGYTYGNTSNTAVAGTPEEETADFVWSSSDTFVANIDKAGKITPTGKAGTTTITLTARNGGIDGKAVTVTAQYTAGEQVHTALKFAAGLTPFLEISQKEISSSDGQPAIVYWTSNLCDKNGETPTEFHVTVTRENKQVYTTVVTGTAENPAGSVTIPGNVLEYDYSGGSNTFTVTISASYGGQTYSGTATISLEAQPAQVSLGKLGSYYITDQIATVPISWSVTNLDRRGEAQESDIFRFQITRDNDLVNTSSVTLGEGTGDGSYSGAYTLNIADVAASESDPSSYRQVYTVTLQAKNGEDSTWSYDSFLLYVYDADALKIMVDGAEAGNSLTMSNRDEISGMSQEQILALKRDIYLKDVISANYGQYAWAEVADQIAWASSNSDVASVNYQQGTLYEDIRNFPYVSYRPTEDFMLSGKTDGTTAITATHKLTGMTDSLNVTVETLKDRLYLFQCYPQAETKLTFRAYTSADKAATKEVTITSDSSGAAAYYAEYGIASDVYCQSTGSDGNLYVGTFYRSDLKTGEQDAATMALYPCNNLQLRWAA